MKKTGRDSRPPPPDEKAPRTPGWVWVENGVVFLCVFSLFPRVFSRMLKKEFAIDPSVYRPVEFVAFVVLLVIFALRMGRMWRLRRMKDNMD